MARQAVQALAQQPQREQLLRAESQALQGGDVPGVAPVVLPQVAVAAMDDTAGLAS